MMRMPNWKWVVATLCIISGWLYGAAIVAGVAAALVPGDESWRTLLRELATFIPFIIATPLAWRIATRQPAVLLVNARGRIELPRIARGFVTWFVISAVSSGIDWVLRPDDYRITFALATFLPFLAVAILLLPVQCWAEELFFRAWILRWSAALPKPAQAVISGAVFAAPHLGNPEAAQETMLALSAWFLLGAGWAWVSARDGGIELAMGAHLANNVFSLLIVGYDDAALPTSAFLTTSALDMPSTLLAIAIATPLFVVLTRRRAGRDERGSAHPMH